MGGSDRSDWIGVARWQDGLCNGWLGDGLDGLTDWTGSMDWMACDGMGQLSNRSGTGSEMDGSASRDGWQWTARNGTARNGTAWQWTTRRRAMDRTQTDRTGSASRDGRTGYAMNGSAMDWTARQIRRAQWIGRGNGRLGVARWIGRLAMGRARQWTAWLGIARWIL